MRLRTPCLLTTLVTLSLGAASPSTDALEMPVTGTTVTQPIIPQDVGDALPSGMELMDYVNTLKPSIVSVIATDRDGADVASGSGVIVGPNLVIANHQVVARGTSARIRITRDVEVPVDAVVTHDLGTNLVVLRAQFPQEFDRSLWKPMPIAASDPVKDQEVVLITNPIAREHAVALGTVHGVESRGEVEHLLRVKTQYPVASTGGPFVNGAGEIVAIAAIGSLDGQHQKFAIPASAVKSLIASKDDTIEVSLVDYHTSMQGTLASVDGEAIEEYEIKLDADIVKRDDGSLVIDDTYIVKGSGTREDPYRVTWDLLTSTSRAYQPRKGLDELPERVTFLNDKWVTLSGYVAFPLMTDASDQILLMLNQWDGCCVGVPPTPYDAIEVTLKDKVRMEGGLNIFNYGEVTGKLKVDPYVVNKWLIGLYLMENAEVRLEM